MELTLDPDVVIEERSPGYVRYRNVISGRHWEVFGTCIWTDPETWGPCGDGTTDPVPGPPEGRLDIPVTPDFTGCCPFRYVELDPGI